MPKVMISWFKFRPTFPCHPRAGGDDKEKTCWLEGGTHHLSSWTHHGMGHWIKSGDDTNLAFGTTGRGVKKAAQVQAVKLNTTIQTLSQFISNEKWRFAMRADHA